MSKEFLFDALYRSTVQAMGSSGHSEIADFLMRARKRFVSIDARDKVLVAMRDGMAGFEKNIDLIVAPRQPVWMEWAALQSQASGHDRTGCLMTTHPENENLLCFVTGWNQQGHALHAHSTAFLDLNEARVHAYQARRFFSGDSTEAMQRLMGLIKVSVPAGFQEEIDLLSSDPHLTSEAAMRRATEELPFVLAILVGLQANGGLMLDEDENFDLIETQPLSKRPFINRLRQRLAPQAGSSFRRVARRNAHRLYWQG